MKSPLFEYPFYNNFNELTTDILLLAKEVLPNSFLFLSIFTKREQYIIAISSNNENIEIKSGGKLPLNQTLCNRIDFKNGTPLKYEDLRNEPGLDEVKETLMKVKVNAYLGIPILLKNGEIFGTLCAVNKEPTKFDDKSIHLFEKISKLFSYYLELERVAFRDYLTGCYNRHFLEKYFDEYKNAPGSILFLDLDGFKEINDNFGHETGDMVLKECTHRIENIIQQNKLNGALFRIGGDEFLIHLIDNWNELEINHLAQTINISLSSWDLQAKDIHLSVSIGIVARGPENRQSLNELLKDADKALYKAKASGKNTYKYFISESDK